VLFTEDPDEPELNNKALSVAHIAVDPELLFVIAVLEFNDRPYFP